jgi:hypothetical protein
MATGYTEHSELGQPADAGALPRTVRLFARLLPGVDREAILGDLIEDAAFRDLRGARRVAWLAGECGSIAAGLSLDRARSWLVMPPVREVVSGLAIDGRGVLRDRTAGTLVRALVFVASVATLVLGAEVLIGALMSAAGF